jgi:hypothetical protein
MKPEYPCISAQQCIVFLAIPRGRDGGMITDVDQNQNRLLVVIRQTVKDALTRTLHEVGDEGERRSRIARQSIIVGSYNELDINIACGIICMEVARSKLQIRTLDTFNSITPEKPDYNDKLEELLSKSRRFYQMPIEFTWIPVRVSKEAQGVSADKIYSYPVSQLLKTVFPDTWGEIDILKLIRIATRGEIHAAVIYPSTSRVVLITEFGVEKL